MKTRTTAVTRRRSGLWWGLAVAVFVLLLRMPASYPAAIANAWCAERCRLVQMEGPWWSGQGQLHVQTSPGSGWRALGPLAWEVWPALDQLLALRLAGGRARLLLDGTGLRAEIDSMVLPAGLVLAQPALGLPAAGWHGRLQLSRATVRLGFNAQPQGSGQLDWLGAGSSLLEDLPLGDLGMRWTWDATQGLQAQIQGGRPGQIDLDSELRVAPREPGRRLALSLQGQLVLTGSAQPVLDKYLRLLGQDSAQGAGKYQLAWPRDQNS